MSDEPPPPSKLTWINYENPAQQRKEYESRVRSHATGYLWRSRRRGSKLRPSPPTTPSLDARIADENSFFVESQSTLPEPATENEDLSRKRRKISLAPNIDRNLISLRNVVLDTYPIPRCDSALTAIEFCLKVWAPTRFPLHVKLNIPNPYLTRYFPMALENTEFLSSQLALSQTLLCANSQISIASSKEVLYYRGDAFKRLREKLQASRGHVDDAMMFTTLGLMHLDVILGEFAALLSHRNGLHHMAQLWARSADLDSDKLIRSTIAHIDQFYALNGETMLARQSIVQEQVLSYPQVPLPEELRVNILSWPNGLRELALQGLINTDLLETVRRMVKWQDALNRAKSSISEPSPEELEFILNYAALDDIRSLNTSLMILRQLDSSSSSRETSIEQCLCHGLTFYCYNIFNQPRLRSGFEKLGEVPLMAITTFRPSNELEKQCLIWTWVQAIDSSKIGPTLMAQGVQLLEILLDRYPEVEDAAYLDQLFRKFFWNELLAGEWRECWDQVVSSRRPPVFHQQPEKRLNCPKIDSR